MRSKRTRTETGWKYSRLSSALLCGLRERVKEGSDIRLVHHFAVLRKWPQKPDQIVPKVGHTDPIISLMTSVRWKRAVYVLHIIEGMNAIYRPVSRNPF